MCGCLHPADEDAPTDGEKLEDDLERLASEGADPTAIGEAAWTFMEHLLDIEHLHLAAWHACRFETSWDDARKLVIIERLWRHGLESFPIQLCHRWKLSETCYKKKRQLYQELFPKLPPRTDKKETP